MLTLSVHVHPGSSQERVGGEHDGALCVYVKARAVDGAATEAVLKDVASAFGVRPRQVALQRGATSRVKTIQIDGDQLQLSTTLAELLALK